MNENVFIDNETCVSSEHSVHTGLYVGRQTTALVQVDQVESSFDRSSQPVVLIPSEQCRILLPSYVRLTLSFDRSSALLTSRTSSPCSWSRSPSHYRWGPRSRGGSWQCPWSPWSSDIWERSCVGRLPCRGDKPGCVPSELLRHIPDRRHSGSPE